MLENNQIILGDCYELIKQVDDKSVDLIITDPPYKIAGLYQGTGIFKDRVAKYQGTGIFSQEGHNAFYVAELMQNNLGLGIDLKILDEYMRVMKQPNIYIWCNKEQIYDYITYFVKENDCRFEIFIWAKNNVPPFTNGHFLKDKEYCLYFWKNIQIKPKYEYGRTFFNENTNVKDKKLYLHPTIKPEKFIDNFILNSSNENDLVLDTFSGSGTTCVCAKKLGRRYLGFEINEEYYKISVDRLNGITINDRQKEKEGQMKLF